MSRGDKFCDLAEACLALHEAVKQSGTPAMRSLSEALLLELGRELARCTSDLRTKLNGA
jgi:hypothetical protein